ncbi:nucleotidyltransferase family protein, partial [bacterium]|nr:nucleotidyltransferase family protein [bacterium]
MPKQWLTFAEIIKFVDSKSQNHYNPLFRNDVMVEIHIRLQNTREIYQQNLQEVWRDAVPIETGHAPSVQGTLRLELSDMLIHACLHLDKHFVTTHVQFTSFNDIVNLVRMITSPQPSPPLPNPLLWERENAYKKKAASLNVTIKKSYIEKSIYQTKLSTETLAPSPTG